MASMDDLAGSHVTVFSGGSGAQERTDTGTLVSMEGNWIQLAKDNGERLVFPFTAVRVIKLLDAAPQLVAAKRDLPAPPVGAEPVIADPETEPVV